MLETLVTTFHASADNLAMLSAISIFAALFFGTFVSEDAACIAAGALAASGDISLGLAIGSCFTGIVAGDLGLYAIGRVFGRRVLDAKLAKRFVSEPAITRASEWLDQRGASAIFLSRFVTGLRLPTYLIAGVLRTDFRKFAGYFVLAAAIWTPLVVGAIALFGDRIGSGAIVAGIGLIVVVKLVIRLARWKERRLFVGRVRRMTNWEFWPIWIFYIPVVCYVLLLAVRFRSLTAFTAVNPAIASGGFVGESKDSIYRLISKHSDNHAFTLKHTVVSGGASMRIAMKFIDDNGLSFPVVLKPDSGERGEGVRIVRSESALARELERIDRDHIIQEFFDGDEISIFYYRLPGSRSGKIFSMTRKIFPTVTGDGVSTLADLILKDERAVCVAAKYFKENAERLGHVPEAGDQVSLIRIGTHSRGAIFCDGDDLRTPELEHAVDMICRQIDGFFFGRFDLRYSSASDLQGGRGFKIIELNGVTSESTNIYDPRYSLIDAYRILFRQWRIAFEIGIENRKLGAATTPATTLLADSMATILR